MNSKWFTVKLMSFKTNFSCLKCLSTYHKYIKYWYEYTCTFVQDAVNPLTKVLMLFLG